MSMYLLEVELETFIEGTYIPIVWNALLCTYMLGSILEIAQLAEEKLKESLENVSIG